MRIPFETPAHVSIQAIFRGRLGAIWFVTVIGFAAFALDDLPERYVCDPVTSRDAVLDPPERWPLCSPHFILAGAEKCGTTSMFEYLRAHPDFVGPEKMFMFDRKTRARLVRAMVAMRKQMVAKHKGKGKGKGIPPMLENMFNITRICEHAGEPGNPITPDEYKACEKPKASILDLSPQEIESYLGPVRVAKEVRYFTPVLKAISKSLKFTEEQVYGRYIDLFPRVPVPPSQANQSEALPSHLASNLGKVIGEASPQYLDFGEFAAKAILNQGPRTRLVILLREPVARYNSQAIMVHHMGGTPMDPTLDSFEDNTLRCIGNEDTGQQVHPTVMSKFMTKKGGGLAHMDEMNWDGLTEHAKQWGDLWNDMHSCTSHELGFFLAKGMYYMLMRQWLVEQKYPKEQVLVLPSEQLYNEPTATMHKVAHFAGLRQVPDSVWANATRFRYSPLFFPQNITFTMKVEDITAKKEKVDHLSLSKKAKRYLSLFYAKPNRALRNLLGVDWSEFGWYYGEEDGASYGSSYLAALAAVETGYYYASYSYSYYYYYFYDDSHSGGTGRLSVEL